MVAHACVWPFPDIMHFKRYFFSNDIELFHDKLFSINT